MHVLLAGPFDTALFSQLTGISSVGLPEGQGGIPVTNLAAGLIELGHRVTVVTLDGSVETTRAFERSDVRLLFCPYRGPPQFRARSRALDLFEREISHLETAIRASSAEIVHAHWTYEYAEAAVRSRTPHLVTMHDLGWECLRLNPSAYRFMRLIMKYRTVPRVKNMSVVAPFMAPKARNYGYHGEVRIIPNGVVPPTQQQIKRRDGPVRIVTVGDTSRLKNVRASVEAHRELSKASAHIELHLFGPGLDPQFGGIAPGVVGHGRVSHAELMRFLEEEADILVHPSLHESFGMIIGEAKVRGVPVVAGTRSGGAAYVCGTSGATLVDVRRPREIAAAVRAMIGSEGRLATLAAAARNDATSRLDNLTVTRAYLEAYAAIGHLAARSRQSGPALKIAEVGPQ